MMRNPRWAAAGLIGAAALAVTACGCSSPSAAGGGGGAYGAPASSQSAMALPTATAAASTGALKTEATSAGTVLATGQGMTLYYYTGDKPGSGTSDCTGNCASQWPALRAPVQALAGVTLPGPLGSITRAGGIKQVTIKGYPIYLFAGDKAPGQANGNGLKGEWHVIKLGHKAGSGSGSSGSGSGSGSGSSGGSSGSGSSGYGSSGYGSSGYSSSGSGSSGYGSSGSGW